MTKEEKAVRKLTQLRDYYDQLDLDEDREDDEDPTNERDTLDALNMAIEAIEKEPCEDAVSRQAVLDYISRIFNQGTGKKKSFEFIQKFVEKSPSVTPTPKDDVLEKIREEIEQVKAVMNEEIIDHDRKDLINFVNGLNQSLSIIDKYKKPKCIVGTVGIISNGRRTLADLVAESEKE